jgi:cytochrome c biogenesis protein CcmG/thiol:disulfide interchange protein DsbE
MNCNGQINESKVDLDEANLMNREHTGKPEKNDQGQKPRWGRLAAWGALFALLGLIGLGLIRAQEGPVGPGQRAPDFLLTTFDGQVIDSDDLRGKVVVVNFWASWCKPCESEAADLENAWRIYKARGDVIFLGVDYVDTEPEAMGYLQKFDITYPNGPDLRTSISQAFRIRGVPETYIIGTDGVLVHAQIGPFTSLAQIQSTIDPALPNQP